MSTKVEDILEEARRLSPLEQLDLIRSLSESLQTQYREVVGQSPTANQDSIPSSVRRTKPASNLDDYIADFWPEDESVDDLNIYIQHQRGGR